MKRETRLLQDASDGQTRSRRKTLVGLLILIGAVFLTQVAYFGFSALRSPPGAIPVGLELQVADSFYSLERQEPISLTYQTEVAFSASGPPGETLLFRDYRIERGQAQVAWSHPLTLDTNGVVTGTTDHLHVGLNLLAVEPRRGEYDGHYVLAVPRSSPYDLTGITRTLEISLTPELVSATYRATFSSGATDDDLHDLLAGHIEPALFLKRIFYTTSDDFTCACFAAVSKPQITIRDGISCVEIQVTTRKAQLEPSELAVLLNMSPQGGASATVTVAAGDGVAVRRYSPIPSIAEGRTQSWINSGPIQLDYDASGEISPASDPVMSGRRELQRVLDPLWEKSGGNIVVLFLIVVILLALLAFPLVWLRRHVRRHSAVLVGEADLFPPLESGIGFIIAIPVALIVGGVLEAAIALTGGRTGLAYVVAIWAAATGCVAPLVLHGCPGVRLRWLWLVLAALLAAAALALPSRWSALHVAMAGIPLLLFAYWLGHKLACPGTLLSDGLRSWSGGVRLLGLLMLFIVLLYPAAQTPDFYSPLGGWWPATTGLSLTLLVLLVLVPLAALLAVFGLLRRQGKGQVSQDDVDKAEEMGAWDTALQKISADLRRKLTRKTRNLWALDSSLLAVGQLLLAYFALGILRRPLVDPKALIPIAPVLGWVLFRYLVRRPEGTGLSYAERVVLASEHLRGSIGRAVLGKTSPQEGEGTASQRRELPVLEPLQGSRPEIPLQDALFGWGRADQPWENGKAACARGAVLSAVLMVLYGPAILNQAFQRAATPFVLLEALLVYLVPFVARWLLYAFILGYFFPYIRGRNGWQKGLYLALAISACALAQDIVIQAHSVNDVLGLLFEAGQVIIYLSIVGIWAFDLPRIREAGGNAADLLRSIYSLPFLTSYLSGLVSALVGVVGSAITGKFGALVRTFVEVVLPSMFRFGGVR